MLRYARFTSFEKISPKLTPADTITVRHHPLRNPRTQNPIARHRRTRKARLGRIRQTGLRHRVDIVGRTRGPARADISRGCDGGRRRAAQGTVEQRQRIEGDCGTTEEVGGAEEIGADGPRGGEGEE